MKATANLPALAAGLIVASQDVGEEASRDSGFGAGRERGFGRGGERLFDAGDVRLVVLKLLAEQPSYGYQLIKTMEQRLGGGYTPSAGVIYPTLTMLEEEGLASASTSENKKIYSVTPEGNEYLKANKERIDELFRAPGYCGTRFSPWPVAGNHASVHEFARRGRGAPASRERDARADCQKITEAINAAAKAIDEL